MSGREPKAYKDYRWIVADAELLGSRLAVRGTRLSVSFFLSCRADGMTLDEVEETYGPFPREALAEVLKVASEAVDRPNVAA